MRSDFREYIRSFHPKAGRGIRFSGTDENQPYWFLLPSWLADVFSGQENARNLNRHFVADVLWAQYCLFLFIRIQDDLFDMHTERISLIYAADEFLLEADRVLSKHFRRFSGFWDIYRRCLSETLFAINTVDAMERTPVTRSVKLLSKYTGVCSIFKVGSLALCEKANRMQEFRRICDFADQMAMAGQILDDYYDIGEDLKRGRFNYAASFLLGGGQRKWKFPPLRALKQINQNILLTELGDRLFLKIRQHIVLAREALGKMASPEASAYINSYLKTLVIIENQFHMRRVKIIFSHEILK